MTGRYPIVYVPGWGSDADLFAECTDALADRAPRQEVVDLAGADTLDEMAARVSEALPSQPCALVGCSMGGWISQVVASRHAAAVARLVLASTWSVQPPRFREVLRASVDQLSTGSWGDDLRGQLAAYFRADRRDGPLPDRLVAMVQRVGLRQTLLQARAMLATPDVSGTHAHIAAPTLVVAGALDASFDPAGQRRLATSLLAQNRMTVGFEVIADAAHNLWWEQPERFADALRRWCVEEVVAGVDPV